MFAISFLYFSISARKGGGGGGYLKNENFARWNFAYFYSIFNLFIGNFRYACNCTSHPINLWRPESSVEWLKEKDHKVLTDQEAVCKIELNFKTIKKRSNLLFFKNRIKHKVPVSYYFLIWLVRSKPHNILFYFIIFSEIASCFPLYIIFNAKRRLVVKLACYSLINVKIMKKCPKED